MWLKVTFLLGYLTTIIIANSIDASISIEESSFLNIINNDNNYTSYLEAQFTGGSFQFPTQSTKILLKHLKKYISKNVLVTRGQINSNKFYFALPRYKSGIASTLVEANTINNGNSMNLIPYPSLELQEEGNCNALQSVVDIVVDDNKILWALDTGLLTTLETPIRYCPPKVVAFDLQTNKIVNSIILDSLVTDKSRLQFLIVDVNKDNSVYLYVSDAANRAIIAFDVNQQKGYRIVLPNAVTHGCKSRDVLYLALTRQNCGLTTLYFTYLGANKLYAIETSSLRSSDKNEGTIIEIGTKPYRNVLLGTDNKHIIFRREGGSDVYSWDTRDTFDSKNFNVIFEGATSCRLATHVFTDNKSNSIRLLQSNFPDYFKNTVGCGVLHEIYNIKNSD